MPVWRGVDGGVVSADGLPIARLMKSSSMRSEGKRGAAAAATGFGGSATGAVWTTDGLALGVMIVDMPGKALGVRPS